MSEDIGFYIDEVCIPHTWYPMEDGRSNRLSVRYDNARYFMIVEAGHYTVKDLGVAVGSAMNVAIATVISVTGMQYLESVYVAKKNSLTISLT